MNKYAFFCAGLIFWFAGCSEVMPIGSDPSVRGVKEDGSSFLHALQAGYTPGQSQAPLVALAPDGKTVLLVVSTPTMAQKVTAWDLPSERLKWSMDMFGVQSIRFDSKSKRFVAAQSEGVARVFDAGSGQSLFSLRVPTGITQNQPILYDALFSPDPEGSWVVAVGQDGLVVLWEGVNGTFVRTMKNSSAAVMKALFYKDGKTLLTVDEYMICRWNVTEGTMKDSVCMNHDGEDPKSSLKEGRSRYSHPVYHNFFVSLSKDEQMLVLTKPRGIVQMWDAERGILLYSTQGSEHEVFCTFSPDGKWMLFFQQGRPYALTNPDRSTAQVVLQDFFTYRQPDGTVHHEHNTVQNKIFWGEEVSWLLNQRSWSMPASASGASVVVWDPNAEVSQVALSPHLVNGLAYAWNNQLPSLPVHGWKQVRPTPLVFPTKPILNIPVSMDGTESQGFLDPQTGTLTVVVDPDGEKAVIQLPELKEGNRIALSGDGKRVLVAGPARATLIELNYDKKKRKSFPKIRWVHPLRESLGFASFAPGSKRLVWTMGPVVEWIDVRKGKTLVQQPGEIGEIRRAVYAKDGKVVALVEDRRLHISNATGRLKSSPQQEAKIQNVSFHSPGVFVGLANGRGFLLDPKGGQEKRSWVGHTQGIQLVSFSKNGNYALTFSADRTIRLWLHEKQLGILYLEETAQPPIQMLFSKGNRLVRLVTKQGQIRWNVASLVEGPKNNKKTMKQRKNKGKTS